MKYSVTQYSSARGSFPEHFLEVSATKDNEDSSGVAFPRNEAIMLLRMGLQSCFMQPT